ncbi:hypothetical protein [Acinetobacter variabilis]|uniref:hypothetical protein n=1 Tax=Acinetobacter variabilis TaxID=70346 RepID=UPI00289DE516|nr:hypothetical protein [Acinetobacter variabilis]
MKNLSLFFFIVILAGCGHKESNGQQLDLETIKKEQLEFAKEATKEFIPNPDSAKFRNQIGECGELSYMEDNNQYSPFKRFVMVEKNIILIEGWTGQEQFELAWKMSC